jgi:hypothetical protein
VLKPKIIIHSKKKNKHRLLMNICLSNLPKKKKIQSKIIKKEKNNNSLIQSKMKEKEKKRKEKTKKSCSIKSEHGFLRSVVFFLQSLKPVFSVSSFSLFFFIFSL